MTSSFFSKKWKQVQNWLNATIHQFLTFFYPATKASKHSVSRILCVDDDHSFCLFVQRLADSVGVQVDSVYSMKEAKQIIEKNPDYQAFIIDGHLPDGSGFELVAWIREKKELAIPIGFISRIYQDAASFRFLKENLQVDYVLEKPIRPSEIHQLLSQLCHLKISTSSRESFPSDLLADLKVGYQKTIADKIERLEKMILTVQKEPTFAHLQALRGEVHKIAGSAGSYGYKAVSELCKTLELELIQQMELVRNGEIKSKWFSSLDNFFTQIKLHFQIEFPLLDSQTASGSNALPSVYIIEEDATFLHNFTQSVQAQHFDILTDSHLEKAIQTLVSADFYPQILLLNAHYSSCTLTGYELIKTFYQKNDYLTTLIALMVEQEALEDQVEALNRGMTFILAKPFDSSLLLPLLDQTPFRALPLHYKILVVDDDHDICQYILKMLKYTGLKAIFIQSFDDLDKTVVDYQPDLILLDFNLADERGRGMIQKLREDLGYQKLLVGMLTITQKESDLIQKSYDANINEIIFKPIEGTVLQRKIAYLLKKQAEQALAVQQDPTTGLQDLQTLTRYLSEWQRQSQAPFPKLLVLFEIENFSSFDSNVQKEMLTSISQKLEDLLKKYEMAFYLEQGRFALLFQGYDPHFVQLFIHVFLKRVHAHLQTSFHQDIFLLESLEILSKGETAEEILQRGEQLLHLAKQQPRQPVRFITEYTYLAPKEVLILQDETQVVDAFKQLFEQQGFKVTLLTKLEEEFPSSLLSLSLLILSGSLAETKGLSLLKKLFMQSQVQIPILYLSDWPEQERLYRLLKEVNYFEKPFSLVIFMTKEKSLEEKI